MPVPKLAIVADDLTGALDAAAPFASATTQVTVATRPEALTAALAARPDIVAVSTRSREIGADAAARRVAAVLAGLPQGVRIVKKIDSRLKGNVAAELAVFSDRPLLVLPALPEFGRVVRNGSVEGFGVSRPVSVRAALGPCATRAVVPDTLTQAEIETAISSAPAGAILVGARGLALALAKSMGIVAVDGRADVVAPVCIVVGSTDPITLEQVAALRKARPDAAYVAAPSGVVPQCAVSAPVTLVQATPGAETRAAIVAATFARSAAPFLKAARSVVITGGATAEVMFDTLEIDCLDVVGEALPGMPVCRAEGKIFVTKSGGFGAPDSFVRLAEATARAEAD